MRHGSLFSGIEGFGLAAEWLGWENIFQVEIDGFCIKLLEKNFPNTKRYGDIKEFNGTEYRGLIDIISGGFPCQPYSVAGKQRSKDDPRALWPEMLRVIREIQPPWVVGENVPGIIRLALEDICTSLESEGYKVQPFIIPSASIGAWDKRERVWIIAYSDIRSRQKYGLSTGRKMPKREVKINSYSESTISEQSGETRTRRDGLSDGVSDINSKSMEGYPRHEYTAGKKEEIRRDGQANWLRNWIEVASELCGSNARVPHRMDRIKALGNSVNPHVVYEIFKAIEQYRINDC